MKLTSVQDTQGSHQMAERPRETVEPIVRADSVSKIFPSKGGDVVALKDVNWRMEPGEFVALIGPSGCGKSTLLNLVAGLLSPTQGTVTYRGERLRSINTDVGYMTQQDAVFPWRTVLKNIMLPLELAGVGKAERLERAKQMIHFVDLDGFEDSYPGQLSGGMRKRVGLAQTLADDPETVLLDEPFGALDAMLKLALQAQLMEMIQSDATAVRNVLLVTHDLDEAITLGDRVVIMSPRPGRVRTEIDVPIERPRDPKTIRDAPEFQEKRREIWAYLQDEVRVE